MNKVYLIDWANNYGMACVVIVGNITKEQAEQIAIDQAGAWPDSTNVQEIKIDSEGKPVIIYPENNS